MYSVLNPLKVLFLNALVYHWWRVYSQAKMVSWLLQHKSSDCGTLWLSIGPPILPYFLECFSPSNCIRPLIVFAQQSGLNVYCVCPRIVFARCSKRCARASGLNVYCVRPRIVFARCSKRCARAIVIRKDNPLSGKVSFNRKVKSVWMVRKKWQKKLQMQQKWQKEKCNKKEVF